MSRTNEIWFIANFHSGTLSFHEKEAISEGIKSFPNSQLFITQYPIHACELAQQAIDANIEIVVAIGGDGTINEIGSILRGSNVKMGIVPIGSGNGLARHLKLPLNPVLAVKKVYEGKLMEIDTCTINDIPFFCTAGVGFDAQVAFDFSKKKKRGFLTYIKTACQTFYKYKGAHYQVVDSNGISSKNAFAITFANAAQYGNDAIVAPESKIDDGLIDMVVLRPFSVFYALFIAIRLFTNSFSKSKFVTTIKGTEFTIKAENNLIIHFDGEPKELNTNELVVKINQAKLKVIV
jgi:diacylglycerol kinase (ATP)